MNRGVLMLFLAAVVAAEVGCAVDPCTLPNTGKDGKLSFVQYSGLGAPARGMTAQVELLRGPPGWDTKPIPLTRLGNTCVPLDDLDIQVALPEAFGDEPVTLVREPEMPVEMQFKCTAPAGELQEVKVTLSKDGKVQYEDRFEITCQALESAVPSAVSAADPNARELTGNGYVVGGLVHVDLGMSSAQGPLIGLGATPADGLLQATGTYDRVLNETYRVLAAGENPVLQIASLRAAVPMKAYGPSEWTVKAQQLPSPAEFLLFDAWPEKADGTQLDGLEECQWEVFSATRSVMVDGVFCKLSFGRTLEGTNEPVVKACVTGLGRSACVNVASQQ